jgi:hypothetical protein
MGGACSANEGDKCIQNCGRKAETTRQFERFGRDGRIILKWNST